MSQIYRFFNTKSIIIIYIVVLTFLIRDLNFTGRMGIEKMVGGGTNIGHLIEIFFHGLNII